MDIRRAKEVYESGGNVTDYLKQARGQSRNDAEIIEIAYDLQAGSYSSAALKNADRLQSYADQVAAILSPYLRDGDVFLDIGTGECTTLAHLERRLPSSLGRMLACDISWSRLCYGRAFLDHAGCRPVDLFAADLLHLPLQAKSVDIVWSSHALEPNGGNELAAIEEILRVCRSYAVLFEPSYEKNSPDGRARMDRLGYVKDLPGAIAAAGGDLLACIPIREPQNPLNPTHAYVIRPPASDSANTTVWACPVANDRLSEIAGFLYSRESGLAYPVLKGVPILRKSAGVLATVLDANTTIPA